MTIKAVDITRLDDIKRFVASVSDGKEFSLPEADIHVVGISSGVDSTAVAIVLRVLFPQVDFKYVFTDTGVEVDGTYEQISRIESLLDINVERIAGKLDLFGLIEAQGNYLPSQRQRYCTRMAKIMPLQAFFAKLRHSAGGDLKIASYVGIRADEPSRKGGEFHDGSQSYFPLQALGLNRSNVYRLVDRFIGIPSYYIDKSRSGCEVCIFSRRSELISRIEKDTKLVIKASQMEPVTDHDKAGLLKVPKSIPEELGQSPNHVCFAKPSFIFPEKGTRALPERWENERSKSLSSANLDLFSETRGKKTFWVAIQHEMVWLGDRYDTCFQRFITYSTSQAGIKIALKHYWLHKLDTMELSGVRSEDELRDELKIAIYEISIDDTDVILNFDFEGVYTWQNDRQPILLVRKLTKLLSHVLQHAWLKQINHTAARKVNGVGRILWAIPFTPPTRKQLVDDLDIVEAPVVCNSCSR